MPDGPVILFDGHCLLCQRSVRFIHGRDRAGVFRFGAQQSAAGQAMLAGHGLPAEPSSVIVVTGEGEVLTHSDAVLYVAGRLGFPWRLAGVLRGVPRGVRDWAYGVLARHRYRVFGRSAACFMPAEGLRERFVGDVK